MRIIAARDAFKIKTTLLPVLIIELLSTEASLINTKLAKNALEAPKLIRKANVIIDLDKLESTANLNLCQIAAELARFEMTIIGIKDSNDNFSPQIANSKFNSISNINTSSAKPAIKSRTKSKIHKGNLRSGQQIYAKDSDLIIMGSVNHGAEVAADGNIHIYGSLKGKALAGVQGDLSARIFSLSFSAQLAAIAGIYKVFENIPRSIDATMPAHAYLENDKIELANI